MSVVGAAGARRAVGAAGEGSLCQWSAAHPVKQTQADGQTRCIARGYEQIETITAQLDGVSSTWTERRLLVQSLAALQAAKQSLHTRLKQAQQALSELVVRRQGKAVLSERTEVEQAVADTLAHFRVQGLLLVTVTEKLEQQSVRAYRDRAATVRIARQFTITSEVQTEAVREASEHLAWRVYATNRAEERLPLTQAVEVYRDEYLVEHNFGRLKGHPLSLSPDDVERDDHATGLVRLLSIALRVLTLLEVAASSPGPTRRFPARTVCGQSQARDDSAHD